ncbi:deoxyuridine 5'-triphosphate nucleotidohydrolase-like [Heterodontus francisci]|uniref:deoxyuridine 5'-triphosphate nucleotidohydrolase-like n=1 Tax=Heterodontus francisci TaxID=7792 RepID=UPI00355C19BF
MALLQELLRCCATASAHTAATGVLGKAFCNSVMKRMRNCSHKASAAVSPAKRSRVDKAVLRFARLSENAYTPTRGSERAAGFDLYSAYDYVVLAQDKVIVKTDIQIAVPSGFYGRVAPRSGLAAKHFIDVGAGVIDEDYRGNVGVVLFNFGKKSFEVKKGDRIAQLICERICYPELEELKTLDETERGADGFGSTGTN